MRIEYEILECDWLLYIPRRRLDVGRHAIVAIFIIAISVSICVFGESKIVPPDSLEVDLAAVKGLVDRAR